MTELYHPAERTQSDQPGEDQVGKTLNQQPKQSGKPSSSKTLNQLPDLSNTTADRPQEAIRVAAEFYEQGTDWVTFYREVLGVDGVVRRIFANAEEANAFEVTAEFAEIQQMVAKLRERSKQQNDSDEPTRVITVRLPKSLHESLRAEAHQKRTSMNQLCISKLLQVIDTKLVPSD